MYNQIFADYDVQAFNLFVEDVKKKHFLKGDTKILVEIILEALKEQATKRKNNNMAAFGIDDKTLTRAIIKADGYVDQYKKSKEKKETKTELPRNETRGDVYFDKNGQKHTKKKTEKKVEKKEEKGGRFDLTQLELFDFE